MVIKFTARTVSSLRSTGRRAEYVDADCAGLVLRVSASGEKSWWCRYRHRGRTLRLSLGRADVLSLADARLKARDALRDVADGKNPAQTKKEARTAPTLSDLSRRYLNEHAKPKKRSWKQDDRLLRGVILPAIGEATAVADISRGALRDLVMATAQRAPVQANRVLALLSRLFKFAVDADMITGSPVVHISRPTRESARERVLTDDELRRLWSATEALALPLRAYWCTRLLTAQRGGECRDMRWSDIDLTTGWWTIPTERAKNRRAHRVPLSAPVLDLLNAVKAEQQAILDARERRGDTESKPLEFVFAEARGARQHRESAATFNIDGFKGHDLRRTAATKMREAGVPRADVSMVLNHVEGGPSATRVYDRYEGDAEKRRALDLWAERLTCIVNPRA